MLKRLRIAVLLYVLLFVAVVQYFDRRYATDWDTPLRVDVYAVAGDSADSTRRYLDGLEATEFKDVAPFFAREAERYGVALDQPFRVRLVGEHREPLPSLGSDPGFLGVLWWSLRMRWLATRLRWRANGPRADVLVFAVFHAPSEGVALDRSTALEKGLIAVANLFATPDARATNQVVLAHELLHTLGATDKYAPTTSVPIYPLGYAAPDARPLLPQTQAELMAGRIPIDEHRAEMPASLRQVVIGAGTAAEIGWKTPGQP